MSSFLYGLSVQGVQEFIFKTNKLKEIIGASQIIKNIENIDLKKEFDLSKQPQIIIQAAGNIRAIVDDEEDVKKIVKYLPKFIIQQAYGLNIAQALVVYTGDYSSASRELEHLLKIERNKKTIPLDFHFSALKQNPKTSLPAVDYDEDEIIDQSSKQKRQCFDECIRIDKKEKLQLSYLANSKRKLALFYADGNSLGKIVAMVKNADEFANFSKKLDTATKQAYKESKEKMPNDKIRDIILGGDDLVMVCDADIALDFSINFLERFEINTKDIYANSSLSACGALVYFNEKYPIHYVIKLAKLLCSYAKKYSKNISQENPPSSLMFHNIKSCNIESYEKIIQNELIINDVYCNFGPYYLNEKHNPNIKKFKEIIDWLKTSDFAYAKLREWLSILQKDKNLAQEFLNRFDFINEDDQVSSKLQSLHAELSLNQLTIQKDNKIITPVYDILQILSVQARG